MGRLYWTSVIKAAPVDLSARAIVMMVAMYMGPVRCAPPDLPGLAHLHHTRAQDDKDLLVH